jgi:iron complex outermembrane recepter protein
MKLFFFLLLTTPLYGAVEKLEEIEITHSKTINTLVDFAPGVTTLGQNELKKRRELSLGDTLRSEAGIQSSSFGPNASRPIIRGLDGDRIRVLQNGLGVLDASSQSADHAVPVDTMVVDSIEVVRGPMSLLYGASAVGGVVNVNTNRIHSNFEKGAISEFLVQGDSSQNALTTGARLDYGANNWMLHFDGGYRNANDLQIPGYARSDKLRSLTEQEDEAKNKLPNSASTQRTAALGVSKIFNRGHLGASYYFLDNLYGVVADEEVLIKMKQNRFELHGEYRPEIENVKAIKIKTAQSDYGHKELEGSEVGGTFKNEGNETRLEVITEKDKLKGVSGVQTQFFNFSAQGEEAFLPPTKNRIIALFTLQELSMGAHTYSAGLRVENFNLKDDSTGGVTRSFRGMNGSLGHRLQLSSALSSSINLSYTERAPNFQELFAEGGHVATGTYERGNPDLNKENAYAIELGLDYHRGSDGFMHFSVYAQQFDNYIALADTGTASNFEDFDNIFQYSQVDAFFYGLEFDSRLRLKNSDYFSILRADYVRAKDTKNSLNLPRIAAPRLTLGLEKVKDRWTWDVEAQHYFEQHQTAQNELRTESFTLLNAGFIFDVLTTQGKLGVFARVKNLLNVEARQHTSLLKDISPMAGRHLVAGVQFVY